MMGTYCRSKPLAAVVVGLVLASSACGGDGDGEQRALTRAVIGEDGGTLEHGPLRLTVPTGALARPTELSIGLSKSVPAGAELLSPVFDLGPPGLEFAVPITVSFEAPANGAVATIVWSRADDPLAFQMLPSFHRQGRVESLSSHFSTIYLANAVVPGQVACCAPKNPSLHNHIDCLYAPNSCDTTICDLQPGRCPPSGRDCCSAIDPNNDYLPDGCNAVTVTSECLAPNRAPFCQWNSTCPVATEPPPLKCCTIIDPLNPPPGLANGCLDLNHSKCEDFATFCQWNTSNACPIPPQCCAPIDPMDSQSVPVCAGADAYFQCEQEPDCQWQPSAYCDVPPPPTSCCYALDPDDDPAPCSTLPDEIECELSAGAGKCKWNAGNAFCQGGPGNMACCRPNNPQLDYQPGGCWSFTTHADCTTTGTGSCFWSTDPHCPQAPLPPPCCAPATANQDDPNTPCANRTAFDDCASSAFCAWTASTTCPTPPPPNPACCAPLDPMNDATSPPCGQRLTHAGCLTSSLCAWNAGPNCPVPPPPQTCCSPTDPINDLPGVTCAALGYADCNTPLAAIYCDWNPGPACPTPTTCCTPRSPLFDYQPGGCAGLPDYAECVLSAGAGVCQWNPGATCPLCPFPFCVDNLSTTTPGSCGSHMTESACLAAAPGCAWGCGFEPDVCCGSGASTFTCAALGQTACEQNAACTFSTVGTCP